MSIIKGSYAGTENSLHVFGGNKKNINLTNERKNSSQKMFKPVGNMNVPQRSFGDISNRVDRTNPLNPNIHLDKNGKGSSIDKIASIKEKNSTKPISPFPEPDFRPDFEEFEDYADILPPCLQLPEEINNFMFICKTRSYRSTESLSSSPKHSPEFIPLFKDEDIHSNKLEAVIDDDIVFDLPSPVWDI